MLAAPVQRVMATEGVALRRGPSRPCDALSLAAAALGQVLACPARGAMFPFLLPICNRRCTVCPARAQCGRLSFGAH